MKKHDAIKHFGGVTSLARALHVNRTAIYQWKSIPLMRQLQIERLTHGVLKAEEIPIPFKKTGKPCHAASCPDQTLSAVSESV
jgi:hypothetical protein